MFEWDWYQDTIFILIAFALLWTEWEFIKIKRRLKVLEKWQENIRKDIVSAEIYWYQ